MRITKQFSIILFLGFIFTCTTYSQINKGEGVTQEDIFLALQVFSGIDIYKFNLDSINQDYHIYIVADEYVKRDSIIKSDTLYDYQALYKKYLPDGSSKDAYLDSLGIFTKVSNDSYNDVKLHIRTKAFGCISQIKFDNKYNRKHYWVRFKKSKYSVGKKIPLLFYGSEWDGICDGQKCPRFCAPNNLNPELIEDEIINIPHFCVISYTLEKKK